MTLFNPDAFLPPSTHAPSGLSRRPDVLRPIQYLGNKQRSLGTILSVLDSIAPPAGLVADFFSGTSVVAQGIADLGHRTMAVDVSSACSVIARATLGEGRRSTNIDAASLMHMLNCEAAPIEEALDSTWGDYPREEEDALASRDGERLLELGSLLPQVWRELPAPAAIGQLVAEWKRAASVRNECPSLLSPVFAGTYFGIRQAIALDARRRAVASLAAKRLIDEWEEALLLTALLAAASAAAFSPGKHFAQPHRIDAEKDLSFHAGRILADRAVDVACIVDTWIQAIFDRGRPGAEGHIVLQRNVDDLGPDDLLAHGVTAVYADPPYTAQQYSRFYHVLDTLVEGVPRPLQVVGERVTGGLYPEGRYLSPYCSKRQARRSFLRLASVCRDAGASLLLSYSTSSKGSTGNARMIGLPSLLDALASAYGRDTIEIVEFEHEYRQFNHRDVARSNRSDPEVLVVAHAA